MLKNPAWETGTAKGILSAWQGASVDLDIHLPPDTARLGRFETRIVQTLKFFKVRQAELTLFGWRKNEISV
jgi:hypothetical protein